MTGLAIGGGTGNLLWKGKMVATTDMIPSIPTSLKNPYSLTVKGNGTQSFVYDGSAGKTLNIKQGANVTISSNTSGEITISSSYVNTTYGVVSTSADGLAPKRDGNTNKFLRGDGTWAVPPDTKYTLPTASSSTLGGVKIGSNINLSSGTISLTKENVIGALGNTPLFLTAGGATRKEDVDFNTLTTPGTYRFPNVGTMDGATNNPTTGAGYLIVHNIPSTDYVI